MRRLFNEKDISTAQYEKEEGAWLQGKDENSRRQEGALKEKSKGKKEIDSLKPAYKSLKSDEFGLVYSEALKYVSDYFVVFALRGQKGFKAGFVASKKVGKSHDRNRAKRRMREVVRLNQSLLPRDLWLIMVARRKILKASFPEIERSFKEAIEKMGI